jgi:hypothetical protein
MSNELKIEKFLRYHLETTAVNSFLHEELLNFFCLTFEVITPIKKGKKYIKDVVCVMETPVTKYV